jgi:F-type H+-transporting ATPase subunit delta
MAAKAEGRVAKRYAKALFESVPFSDIEKIETIVVAMTAAYQEHKELRIALLNPGYPKDLRANLAHDLVTKAADGFSGDLMPLKKLVSLLLENGRIGLLPQLQEAFLALVRAAKKIASVEITSAFNLPEEERRTVETKIKQDFGSLAKLEWRVDANIIGGLLVKSGDRLLDGSVRGALSKAKDQLFG